MKVKYKKFLFDTSTLYLEADAQWKNFKEQLTDCAQEFFNQYNEYPSSLVANNSTLESLALLYYNREREIAPDVYALPEVNSNWEEIKLSIEGVRLDFIEYNDINENVFYLTNVSKKDCKCWLFERFDNDIYLYVNNLRTNIIDSNTNVLYLS
ncbi:MAG: hypothetical protein DRP35_10545, partial [Candidatus Zixiibacteriota bacterium]